MALVTVLSMMALTTILVLAFFSLTQSEYQASQTYATGQAAKAYADTALNIVISQIRAGAERAQPGVPVIHATQPGALRKYNQDGAFIGGYKLYSDDNLIFTALPSAATAEQQFYNTTKIPASWNTGTEIYRYTDINEPVVRALSGGNGSGVQVYFPVIDPRAAADITPDSSVIPVEGFSYSNQQSMGGSSFGINGVVTPGAGGALESLRLPMPVKWMYLLKDGSVGTLDESLSFVGGGGATPSAANPMVARIAFWTDDETCKVNINTASEPTFMGQPRYYHEREHSWTDHPPRRDEFQRYPGHPATVALSSVFYPNPYQDPSRSLELYNVPQQRIDQLLELKNQIYRIMPRIQSGGSEAGTKLFADDDYSKGESIRVAREGAQYERLYASVDELMFTASALGNKRAETNAALPSLSTSLFNRDTLDRASAFLTAQSRASETNMLGYPKVAMWPIAEKNLGDDHRTRFDRLIAFCSSLNPSNPQSENYYYFQRAKSNDSNYDVNVIERNKALMSMLDKMLSTQKFPISSTKNGPGNTYKAKYGAANAKQILVQIFDYIRSTNLYDGVLAPQRDDTDKLAVNWRDVYIRKDQEQKSWKTYTSPSFRNNAAGKVDNPFEDKVYPSHGQVASSLWSSEGKVYKGIGRDLTISEIGLHFICTGDGQNDLYSWRIPTKAAPEPSSPSKYPFDVPIIPEDQFDDDANQAIISGGRTAIEFGDQEFVNGIHYPIMKAAPRGFTGDAYLRNLPTEWGTKGPSIKKRFYSNYPVLKGALGMYGTVPIATTLRANHPFYARSPGAHPGYDPLNWNCTLDVNKPLLPHQKRIQASLNIELFCPSVGYTQLFPEFTLVLKGSQVSGIEVDGKAVFSTTSDIVIKSNGPLYDTNNTPEIGGFASFRQLVNGRRGRGIRAMPTDEGYDSNATGQKHEGLINMDLLSSFFTVNADAPMTFNSGGEISIRIYNTHDWQSADPVQIVNFTLPSGSTPPPDLVVKPSYHVHYVNANGTIYDHPQVQAPRWWCFHRDGAIGRYFGEFSNPQKKIADFDSRGRLYTQGVSGNNGLTARGADNGKNNNNLDNQRVPGINALLYGADGSNTGGDVKSRATSRFERIRYTADGNEPIHYGTDSVRTLVPGAEMDVKLGHGDARLIAAKAVVASSDWSPHPLYYDENVYMAHNLSSYYPSEAGFDTSGKNDVTPTIANSILPTAGDKVTPSANVSTNWYPDAVYSKDNRVRARRYGDYDESDPGGRIGPFINKPDEGNYAVGEFTPSGWTTSVLWRATYFRAGGSGWDRFAPSKNSFFTPNRLITSPVMFGSLPPNVWSDKSVGAWRTLLFRPHTKFGGTDAGETNHPGESVSPADHNLLELFWMPVVEPYAISEPLSTAGKINMNYQMLPFAHIRRATALHALMKGEMFQAIPNGDYSDARTALKGFGPNGTTAPTFRDETAVGQDKYWHRSIVIDRFKGDSPTAPITGTLAQFDERFECRTGLPSPRMRGIFRTPSQICEVHLLPSLVPDPKGVAGTNLDPTKIGTYAARNSAMANFWTAHSVTGDNTREAPYSNLYARLTTRSNTFRVHVRAETVRKARSSDPAKFDPVRDSVAGEYRGSFLIERYIDVNDKSRPLPDYTKDDLASVPPLESFYRFRVLESKRFSP